MRRFLNLCSELVGLDCTILDHLTRLPRRSDDRGHVATCRDFRDRQTRYFVGAAGGAYAADDGILRAENEIVEGFKQRIGN